MWPLTKLWLCKKKKTGNRCKDTIIINVLVSENRVLNFKNKRENLVSMVGNFNILIAG